MVKLEGFSKVAVIKFGGNYPYHFAIYDDGIDYKVGIWLFLLAVTLQQQELMRLLV